MLVSERPEPGRSCFQALAFETLKHGEPFRTLDLTEVKELGLFPHNVEDHEELVRRIFELTDMHRVFAIVDRLPG